ncbi:MAG: hypothetical protein GY929_12060 [Actinomycetia bacterium]|nr:hypothetical protein [Actinomycetes bacterium]
MNIRSVLRQVMRLVGAVMLGVGILFQPKVRPDDHWSVSPRIQAMADEEAEAAGGPLASGGHRRRTVPGAA